MAINSINVFYEKTSKSQGSSNRYKHGIMPATRFDKVDFDTESSMCSLNFRGGKIKKKSENKSPYLSGDNVSLLSRESRVTEKRCASKKGSNIVSSFPLAANIYKANSDEFKSIKSSKKVQKSVLTLPNDPAPLPEACTVSDINDSEYIKRDDFRKKIKKHTSAVTRSRPRGKGYVFYDRDAQYCSQMDLDCSSADTIKYNGDRKRTNKSIIVDNVVEKPNPHDVWTVLRNINRFQFLPSPHMSEDSFVAPKKTKFPRRRNNRKDMRVFETCCTEEYAYISRYDVDKSPLCNCSHSSSFDKITVIDKQHDFNTFCKQFEEKITKKKIKVEPKPNRKSPKSKSPVKPNSNSFKADTYVNQKNKCDDVCGDSSIICPNYKDLKELLASNTTIDQREESTIIENGEDNTSYGTTSQIISQCSEITQNSGSSKAACQKRENARDKNKTAISPNEKQTDGNIDQVNKSDNQINGITKVVLCKGQNVQRNAAELPKRNACEKSLTSANPVITPKLTKNEIRRQLNKQRFPVVVLNKDQLSSSFRVLDQENVQFNGLEKQIWPFMLDWHGIKATSNELETQKKTSNSIVHRKKGKYDDVEKKPMSKKQSKFRDKKSKTEHERVPLPLSKILSQSIEQQKPTPMRQFRDKMLKLLYKSSINSALNVIEESSNSITVDNANCRQTHDNFTNTQENLTAKDVIETVDYSKKSKIPTPVEKRPWAKAKWASDFIDNVIKKIKSGAYYTNDNNGLDQKSAEEPEEIAIQTISTCDAGHVVANEFIHSVNIPGFGDTIPAVEIKTMNTNEISVKHCVTNIMVRFDVTIPTESIMTVENSSSLIPVDVTKSQTRIFKCETSILNAILPAELCSILPKMLNNIVELGQQIEFVPALYDKTSYLSTIREVTQYENHINTISQIGPTLRMPIAKELWQLLNGRFLNSDKMCPKFHILKKVSLLAKYERQMVRGLIPNITTNYLFGNEVIPIRPSTGKVPKIVLTPSVACYEQINTCRTLQPYPLSDHRIIPKYKPFSFTIFFENRANLLKCIGEFCFRIVNYINNNGIRYSLNVPDIVALSVDNFKTNPLFNGCIKTMSCTNIINVSADTTKIILKPQTNCIAKVNRPSSNDNSSVQQYVSVKNNKIRRKGLVKRNRKHKSKFNISEEKTTRLSNIANMDDFFHALGSGKHLSNVFDGQFEHKIMSSILEMKNWTTEINPKQALLVLLLANKKDTSNLLRYRSVLLQGIAVNRITKANELDMEIEVIERENLNGLTRYEGITYLPASIENQDNLFEELCWIAKTTASDYEKPFDESSEKLLKSLLEKRKKLNPSYLRVMARYVGLGLLKSSCKK